MTGNDTSGEGDGSHTSRSSRAPSSRRRFLKTTVGAGALACGGVLALGTGLGSAAVTGATIEAGDVVSGSGGNDATISYQDGTFVVDGRIGASNPCHTAQFGDVRVEGDTLYVPVETVATSPTQPCLTVLASVEYTAEVTVDERPSRAVVQHHGTTDWQTEWPQATETATTGGTATDTTTGLPPILPGPSEITVHARYATTVDLSWVVYQPARPGPVVLDHFNVYVDGELDHQVPKGTVETTVDALDPGTTYEIAVASADADGTETDPIAVTVTTEAIGSDTVVPAPADLSVEGTSPSSVDLQWSVHPPDALASETTLDHFDVYVDGTLDHEVSATNGNDQVDFADLVATTTVDGLDPDTSYEFWVRGADGSGNVTGTVSARATSGVTDSTLPTIDGAVPGDLDDDGTYEDVNGNNRTDSDDVVTYFEHMDSAPIRNNTAAYDYNGNGRIDFDDLVTLFEWL